MLVSTCRVDQHADLRRGYVLHLTNLEDRPFEYLVNFVMTAPYDYWPPASQFSKLIQYFGDEIQVDPFRRTGRTYTSGLRFRVDAGQTTSVGLQTPPAAATWPDQNLFHVEGYVTLRLPATRTGMRVFLREPQSSRPVRVLLNPETRTFYESASGRMPIYEENDRAEYVGYASVPGKTIERTEPLHVASGKAENELPPEGTLKLSVEQLKSTLASLSSVSSAAAGYRGAELVADDDRVGALVELLCEVGDDKPLVQAINKVLEEQKATMRICPPGRK